MLAQKDFDQIEQIVEEKIKEETRHLPSKEEFYNKMDEVVGELKTIRETLELQGYRSSEHSDQLENHEKRISAIEKKVVHPASSF